MDCDTNDSPEKTVLPNMDTTTIEDPFPDDSEFFILSKDIQDDDFPVEENKMCISDDTAAISEDDSDMEEICHISVSEEKDCATDSVNDSDADNRQSTTTNWDVQKTMDMYVNANCARRSSGLDMAYSQKFESERKLAYYNMKKARLESLLSADSVDEVALRRQAISQGGLLNAELRRRVWPLLTGVNPADIPPKPDRETMEQHPSFNQVKLDVDRSITRFPPGMELNHRLCLQDDLIDVIMRVLVKNPELHYYQGFHDICVTFLLVLDADLAFAVADKIARSHLRDFMQVDMKRTMLVTEYVPSLLKRASPEIFRIIDDVKLHSAFSLSWVITWFGHVVSEIDLILRIYDFFIACNPMMPVYVAGAVVLHKEQEIFDTPEVMEEVFKVITHIPDDLPVEQLLTNAGELYLQYQPFDLAKDACDRYERGQAEIAAIRAQVLARRKQVEQKKSSLLPDGNVTFSRVTFWMLGAVVSVATYALINSFEWEWPFSL